MSFYVVLLKEKGTKDSYLYVIFIYFRYYVDDFQTRVKK